MKLIKCNFWIGTCDCLLDQQSIFKSVISPVLMMIGLKAGEKFLECLLFTVLDFSSTIDLICQEVGTIVRY